MIKTNGPASSSESDQGQSLAEVVLNGIEDGVVLCDKQGLIKIFNPGASRITNLTSAEAIGKPWLQILNFVDRHGLTLKPADNPLQQVLRQQASLRLQEIYILTPQERRLPLHLIITPLKNGSGAITAIVCVMRDMSFEKEQEEAKVDFVSTASHEMRTPLAALEGYLSLLLEQSLDEQSLKYAHKAHQSVMHLGQLFKNLLTTSQSEDGQLSHQPQIFILNDLLEQVIADNRREAAIKEIELRFLGVIASRTLAKGEQIKYSLNADPQRIGELINNVLDNAVKYTDVGGQINISLKKVDNFVQIKVEDSGFGVSPRDLPHLFQKFYRVNNTQPGIGLGLFICKKIVDLYQGDIWLESEVGRGSTFYINLPRYKV